MSHKIPENIALLAVTFFALMFVNFSSQRLWGSCQQIPASQPQRLRTLDDHFPFSAPTDNEAWAKRSEALRGQLAISLGLEPLPEKTPLNAVVHSPIDVGDYIVSHVFFESFPGFFVTGNLYLPKNISEKRPAVLCPHGHFSNGRFTENNEVTIAAMIARNEESEATNARSPLQSRCAHLARMGYVVFHYDMVGYADSVQIPHEVAHGYSKRRADDDRDEDWAFFSPQAEMHLQSIMGLQTWNSIRAIDFLESLAEVDPQRIGVTGCSGGGTQTFILAALDSRIKAAFAAAMVSTGMQGGCTCENACNLRVTTGNVEIAALFAPRPLGLSACNDWTKSMPEDGYPQLRTLYQLFDEPDHVFLAPSLDLPHGYNQLSRRTMYAWFDEYLSGNSDANEVTVEDVFKGKFNAGSKFQERPIEFLSSAKLTVWNANHASPKPNIENERLVTKHWASEQDKKISQALKTNPADLKTLVRGLTCTPVETPLAEQMQLIAGPVTVANAISRDSIQIADSGSTLLSAQRSRNKQANAANSPLAIIVHKLDKTSPSSKLCEQLLSLNWQVIEIDSAQLHLENRIVENGRDAAVYTYGYNRCLLANSSRAIAFLLDTHSGHADAPISLISIEDTEPALIVAAALAETPVNHLVLANSFSFHSVKSIQHPYFLPGALLAGDTAGFLQIAAPKKLINLEKESITATETNSIMQILN